MKTPRRLWYHLIFPLILTFLLLWAGTMVLLTRYACETLEETAQNGRAELLYLAEEQLPFYEKNRHSHRPDAQQWAESIMTYNLSTSPLWKVDGALAWIYFEDGKPIMKSQITTGYAHQEGVDLGTRWHLDLDTGLDDEGQLALARWMAYHHTPGLGTYSLLPAHMDLGLSEPDSSYRDGTFARITGETRPGDVLVVDRIELVHPDGSVEQMVETNHRSSAPVTMDFRFLRLDTVLLPVWNSRTGFQTSLPDLEGRLARWREAQAQVEQESDPYSSGLRTASVYNVRSVAFRQMRSTYVSTLLLTLGPPCFWVSPCPTRSTSRWRPCAARPIQDTVTKRTRFLS